jgi:hypothetical protein
LQIVDTTLYDPATADEGIYKKIVLGAIDKRQDNKGSAKVQDLTSDGQTPHPSRLAGAQVEIGSSNHTQYQYSDMHVGGLPGRVNTR